jgi:hypothetical protein
MRSLKALGFHLARPTEANYTRALFLDSSL